MTNEPTKQEEPQNTCADKIKYDPSSCFQSIKRSIVGMFVGGKINNETRLSLIEEVENVFEEYFGADVLLIEDERFNATDGIQKHKQKWKCERCDASGEVSYLEGDRGNSVQRKVREDHYRKSATCQTLTDLTFVVYPITAEDVREKMWTCSRCKESGVVRVKEIDGKYNFVKSMIADHQNLSKDCYRENGSFFVSTAKGG